MTHPLTKQQKVIRRRLWLRSRLVWAWLIPVLLLQPVSTHAVPLTNTTFADFLTAVQSGTAVFATNGTVIFDDVVVITNNTTIDATGFNVVLSGKNAVRLFEVQSNVSLVLTNLTLANGNSTGTSGGSGTNGNNGNFGGSGVSGTNGDSAIAGAIYNQGNLNLLGCRLIANSVVGGDGGDGGDGGTGFFTGGNGGNAGNGGKAQGGAIYNVGFLSASNCTFSDNTAEGGNGGVGGSGGAGSPSGNAGSGGVGAEGSGAAIYNLGTAQIFNSTFSTNITRGGNSEKAKATGGNGPKGPNGGAGVGGGIYNTGMLAAVNCTFALNTIAGGNGGDGGDGFFQGGDGGNGGLASGGGIYNLATAFITNCTFSGGAAFGGTNGLAGGAGAPGSDGSPGQSRGGNIASEAGRLVLANSILASGTNGGNGFRTVVTNFTDAGFNISSDNSLNLTNTGSLKNTNANLSALGNFGGPTLTMRPLLGSPAINRRPGNILAIDQRGLARLDGANDSGAVEIAGTGVQIAPANLIVAVGGTGTFTATPSGEPPFAFQWGFNNTNIVAATNSTFTQANAQFTNAGNYRVVLTTAVGSVTSSVAVLNVVTPVPPLLDSISVSAETNFTFTYSSVNGLNHFVEFKNTLADSNWTRILTNVGNGGFVTNLFPMDGTTSRFFRLVIQ